ncbi:MAG: Glu-tRNA(Gln) amidotransferase subunit GatE [Candidatus Aenigmatarchaeota archaeon]
MKEVKFNYKELGLKVGLEIHFQLDVSKKLFCSCSSMLKEKDYKDIVIRKLHPTFSELGEIDLAAKYEYLRDRTFLYEVFEKETCLVELDEEPPHNVNKEALIIALQIAKLFNCKIPDEIYVMRKIVIDGSNTSGFQRTMIVGFDGYFIFKDKRVPITQICLEEDSAAIDKEENGKVYYKLNRLGIPLVEIDTGILEDFEPREIEEIAYHIFLIAASTKRIRKVLGSIRQDVNVSIKNGARVEIKGIQRLSLISKVIENEVKRQLDLINSGKRVEKETRAALEDGTTEFMRPLPGAQRMYPETDIKPIRVEELLKDIKECRSLISIIEKYEKEYKLSKELINSLLKSDYFYLVEEIVDETGLEASLVAGILTSTIKEIEKKEKIKFDLNENKLKEFFNALKKELVFKEAAYDILKEMCINKEEKIENIINKLNLRPMSKEEIRNIVREELLKVKDLKKIEGIVISRVRGRANIKKVIEIIREELNKSKV